MTTKKQSKVKQIKSIQDLTPDAANLNKGTERGRYLLETSVSKLGLGRSVLADKNGTLIAGNKTTEVAGELGMSKVRVIETDGTELIVVQRTDLDMSDPDDPRARQLAFADNQVGAQNLAWDAEALLSASRADDLSDFVRDDELKVLLEIAQGDGVDSVGSGANSDAEPQIEKGEELNKIWQVRTGDLWQIGEHRLLCGDSTKKEDVERVMLHELADMVFIDPPYGINYEGGAANKNKRKRIAGDETSDLYAPILRMCKASIKKSAPMYVWFAGTQGKSVYCAIDEIGYEVRALIIWNKLNAHYGNFMAQYMQKHEVCIYAVDGNANFIGASNDVTVWDVKQPSKNDLHPTQKPLELAMHAIGNHNANMVIDFCAGSGVSLVACQNLSRKCRSIEISPAYCAVILQRMKDAFPDLEIKRY